MQKLQILFPRPVMARLKARAREEDRPVSEIVRRAVERHLDQLPSAAAKFELLTFHGGEILVPAERMKEVIYGDGLRGGRRSAGLADVEESGHKHSRLRPQRRRT